MNQAETLEVVLCCGNCMFGMGFPEVTCCGLFFMPTDADFLCGWWLGPEGQELPPDVPPEQPLGRFMVAGDGA